MLSHFNIKIFGRVQGVFFRHESKKIAQELGLTGFVKNLPDGSVYLEVEGDKQAINRFVEWCQSGPPLAKVTRVETSKSTLQNFADFTIHDFLSS